MGRARIQSTTLGIVAKDHPARRKLQRKRTVLLSSVVEQFESVSLEDYMNMMINHYND